MVSKFTLHLWLKVITFMDSIKFMVFITVMGDTNRTSVKMPF